MNIIEEIADDIAVMDFTWANIATDEHGVAIEWYATDATPTDVGSKLREKLAADYDFEPLDGAAEGMYQYYVQVSEP